MSGRAATLCGFEKRDLLVKNIIGHKYKNRIIDNLLVNS